MSKLKVGAVVKFSGKKLIVASINDDGTATLNYAAGSGKTGFYGKVRLSTGKSPDTWNPQVVDKSLPKDEVTTLDLYFIPEELDGSENEDTVVSYIRSNRPLSDEQKNEFLNSINSHVRRMMGMREDLTPEQYEALVNDKDEWARGLVAYNKNLSEEQIVKLSKDKSDSVREAIAWRQDVKTEVLDSLVRDKSIDVRIRIARNPNISDDGQYTLITDRSPRVRAALVENKNALPETLAVLSRDRDKFVKEAITSRNA